MFLSDSSISAADLFVSWDTSSQCVTVRHLAFPSPGQDAVGSSGAEGFQKRFPVYEMSSVCQAASKNRGKAVP